MKILVVLKLTKAYTNIDLIVSVVFFYLKYLARTIEIADEQIDISKMPLSLSVYYSISSTVNLFISLFSS